MKSMFSMILSVFMLFSSTGNGLQNIYAEMDENNEEPAVAEVEEAEPEAEVTEETEELPVLTETEETLEETLPIIETEEPEEEEPEVTETAEEEPAQFMAEGYTATVTYQLSDGEYMIVNGEEFTGSYTETVDYYDENGQYYFHLTDSIPEKDGSLFLGWKVTVNGYEQDGDYYTSGYDLNPEDAEGSYITETDVEVVCTPVWTRVRTFTIAYHLNMEGATLFDSAESVVTRTYENIEERRFSFPWPSKEGMSYIGWSFTADAEDKITVAELFDKAETSSTIDLYARWKEATLYYVIYRVDPSEGYIYLDENGQPVYEFTDTFEFEDDGRMVRPTSTFLYPVSTVEGKIFNGWIGKALDFSGNNIEDKRLYPGDALNLGGREALVFDEENKDIFTASWTDGNTYSMRLHLNGGTLSSRSEYVQDFVMDGDTAVASFTEYDVERGMTLPDSEHSWYLETWWKIINSGSQFMGWSTSPEPAEDETLYKDLGSVFRNAEGDMIPLSDIELYAIWVNVIVPAEKIEILTEINEIEYGNSETLEVEFTPSNTTNQNLTWTSSDESIATVDENGKVTAVGEGKVTITATSEDGGFTSSKEINILFNHLTGISFKEESADIIIYESKVLELIYDPENASLKTVTWESSDESVATVDEKGKVTAVGDGTATVTVTSKDGGYSATIEIHVIIPAQSINISSEVTEILYGNSETLEVEFTPSNTTNQKVTWTSSDESIATVDENGTVTAVGEGKVTITATSEDGGFTASKEINVFYVHVESISFEEETIEVIAGNAISTKVVFEPENVSNTEVIYTSDHPEIATVNEEGTITALSKGTAVITVTSEDGNKTATVMVTVLPADLYVKEVDAEYSYAGTAIKPVPAVYDSGVLLTAGKDYTVTYKNNTNAYTFEGDRSSFTPAKGDKTPYILITGKGNYSGKTYVPFSIGQIDINDADKVYIEESITLKANGKVQRPVPVITFNGKTVNSKEYTLTYLEGEASDSEEIVLDKKTGPKLEGTYTIRIEGKGNNFTGKKDVTLKIAEETNKQKAVALSKAITIVVPSADELIYDGEEKTDIEITPKAAYKGIITEDDYTVAYTKNVNAGTATVTATGKGIYTGTVKKTFKITPRLYAEHKEEFRFEVSDAVYSKGGAIPEVHVCWNEKELTAGTDYTLKYTNNKKAETEGKVKITFKGNFKGSAEEQPFKITKKDLASVNITAKDLVYKKGKYKSTPVLTDIDGKKLKAGADYLKTYEYTGNIVDEDAQPETEITVTVTGTGNYTGSVSTTYHILETGKDISKAVFKIANQEYTGKGITITEMSQFTGTDEARNAYITVNKQKEYLVLGEDFEVVPGSYVKNINKGTAKVTFRGIGEYGGTKTVSFKIGQRSIAEYWSGVKQFFSSLF